MVFNIATTVLVCSALGMRVWWGTEFLASKDSYFILLTLIKCRDLSYCVGKKIKKIKTKQSNLTVL